jgi:ABC-type oligopeptide transport system substrate-binding subunit
MRNLLRFTVLMVFAVIMAIGTSAQDGGILIGSTFGGDPNTINPLLGNSTVEDNYTDLMFPNIFNIDPETRAPMMAGRNDQTNGLALEWTISEDQLVYTFTLRDDLVWSDGTPVTAFDYEFTFDALASELTSSPRLDVLETVDTVEAI